MLDRFIRQISVVVETEYSYSIFLAYLLSILISIELSLSAFVPLDFIPLPWTIDSSSGYIFSTEIRHYLPDTFHYI